MTCRECAELLGVSVRRVQQLIKRGVIVAEPFGNALRVDVNSAYDYNRNRRKPGRPKK